MKVALLEVMAVPKMKVVSESGGMTKVLDEDIVFVMADMLN